MSAPGSIGGGGSSRDVPSTAQLRRLEELLKEHAELVAEFGLAPAVTFRQHLNRVLARQKGDQVVRRVEPATGGKMNLAKRKGSFA